MIPMLGHVPWRPVPAVPKPLASPPAPAESGDRAVLSSPSINRFEQNFRYGNDFVIQLAVGDTPTLLAVAANLAPLPGPLAAGLGILNTANFAVNGLGLAADIRGLRRCLRNPAATRKDRLYDWIHLALGDVAPLAGSVMPLVMSIRNPVAMGIFVGMQLVGVGADVWKTAYDVHRKGQQSAIAPHAA